MNNRDNNRSQDQDIRRQPPQQEQTGGKSAKKQDKQGQQGQTYPNDRQSSENDRTSRH